MHQTLKALASRGAEVQAVQVSPPHEVVEVAPNTGSRCLISPTGIAVIVRRSGRGPSSSRGRLARITLRVRLGPYLREATSRTFRRRIDEAVGRMRSTAQIVTCKRRRGL